MRLYTLIAVLLSTGCFSPPETGVSGDFYPSDGVSTPCDAGAIVNPPETDAGDMVEDAGQSEGLGYIACTLTDAGIASCREYHCGQPDAPPSIICGR